MDGEAYHAHLNPVTLLLYDQKLVHFHSLVYWLIIIRLYGTFGNMSTSRELFDTVQTYYKVSDAAYRSWGPDPERKGVYAIHMGYTADRENYPDNHTMVKQMTRKVVEEMNILPNQRVLDSGCGTGSISHEIARRYPNVEVHGINIVKHQLITADRSRPSNNTHPQFSQQDFLQTAFKDSTFDRVVFCESLAHSDDKLMLIQEAYRLLKKGGQLTIADCFSYEDNLDERDKKHLEYFKIGMGVPSMLQIDEFRTALAGVGYETVVANDITANIFPSALIASVHAEMRIGQDTNATIEVTNGRHAIIGIERLMSSKKVGYYLLTANK
jgi:cyclopropane fatty-acyl-phospholipid synthase-like methyltransferase